MITLYIDTSSSYLYSGIVRDSKLISEVKEELGTNLSSLALPRITSMFDENNLRPSDVDKIIVVNGPGSFTGIRVGLTIAKVYAWSLNIKITTISSLEAMMTSSNNRNIKIPIIDARRDYYYAAIYSEEDTLLEPCHISEEELVKKLNSLEKEYVFITNDEISLNGNKEEYNPDILKIINKYSNKEEINPHSINPNYLKLTAAEEAIL